MNKKFLSTIIAVGLIASTGTTVLAENVQNKIDENKKKIESINSDRKEIDGKIDSANDELNELQKKLMQQSENLKLAQNALQDSNNEINDIKGKLEETEKQIHNKNVEIELLQSRINETVKNLTKKINILGKRFRSMYETDTRKEAIVMLLKSENFGDFLSRLKSFFIIVNADQRIINQVQEQKNSLEFDKSQLEKAQNTLNEQKNEQLNLKLRLEEKNKVLAEEKNKEQDAYDAINKLEEEKNAYIDKLKNDKGALEDKINQLENDNKQLNDSMNRVIDKGASIGNSSGQSFDFPVNGPVTCPFGPRIHPITGKYHVHHGTDIGVPTGTPVLASKDGVVVEASYSPSYGNVVILNHGNGYQTLYAHNSSLCVSTGQTVKKGQLLAYSGSTGWSTGPHCHFEVRYNGECVSP